GGRGGLMDAVGLVGAGMDFCGEAGVPDDLIAPAAKIAHGLRDEISAALADGGRGERLRDGLVVAIAGPPNAGKSTLFNRLARREAAIVSPFAGTTRDVIEVHLELDGYPVTVLDTAGIRDSAEPVEREGGRRAGGGGVRGGGAGGAQADLVLWVIDVSADDRASVESPRLKSDAPQWLIENKIDLLEEDARRRSTASPCQDGGRDEVQFI